MKKIILLTLVFLIGFQFLNCISFAASNGCGNVGNNSDYASKDLSSLLKDCQPDNTLEGKNKKELLNLGGLITISTTSNEGYDLENVKQKALTTQEKLVGLAFLLAIGGLVYAGIMFTTAYGEDAKHKKGKDAIKWSIIGFVVAVIALQLINAVINFIYGLSGK